MSKYSQRAPFNDWWYWSECLVKRFRTIAEIYRENAEGDRAAEAANWSKRFSDNCKPPVEAMRKGMKTDEQKAEVKKLEEQAIGTAADMFREILVILPFVSNSMQDLLYVKWQETEWEKPEPDEIDENTGLVKPKKKKKGSGDQRVTELFWGPKNRQDEGIRGGKVADGGLPGILYNLLVAEKTASSRTPTDYGQALQVAAIQQNIAVKPTADSSMNFRPGGGM